MKRYETVFQGKQYAFIEKEDGVIVLKNGKSFGSHMDDGYIRALLKDIKELSQSNAELFHFKQTVEIVLDKSYLEIIQNEMERKEDY